MLGLEISKQTNFPQIKFSELLYSAETPSWFTWAYSFGRDLVEYEQKLESNLIVLTSPCQSPLIGAVAFGSFVKLLETEVNAVSNKTHFKRLFSLPPGTLVKKKYKTSKKPRVFKLLTERRCDEYITMKQVKGPKTRIFADGKIFLSQKNALNYVLESEDLNDLDQVHSLKPYPGVEIIEKISLEVSDKQNWRNNLDDIVISGPIGGNSSPKKQLVSTNLFFNDTEGLPLHELLAVKEWKDDSNQTPYYSRFLNSSKLKKEMPLIVKQSRFVFYNSIDSFLKFTDRFDKQVQVLITSRDVDSKKIERLFGKLYAYKDRATSISTDVIQNISQPPFGLQLFYYGSKKVKEKQW